MQLATLQTREIYSMIPTSHSWGFLCLCAVNTQPVLLPPHLLPCPSCPLDCSSHSAQGQALGMPAGEWGPAVPYPWDLLADPASCPQPGQSPMPLQAQVKSDHLPVPIIAVGEAFPSYKCRKTEFPFQKLHKIMKINTYFFFFCHTEDFSNSVLYQAMDSIVGQGGSKTWQLTAHAEKKSVQVKICFLSEVHQDLPS